MSRRRVNPKALKVIDAIISVLSEKELKNLEFRGTLNMNFREQLILIFGDRKPKYSVEECEKQFAELRSKLYKDPEKWDWTDRTSLYFLRHFCDDLFI